jgi:hypothetical protein
MDPSVKREAARGATPWLAALAEGDAPLAAAVWCAENVVSFVVALE